MGRHVRRKKTKATVVLFVRCFGAGVLVFSVGFVAVSPFKNTMIPLAQEIPGC